MFTRKDKYTIELLLKAYKCYEIFRLKHELTYNNLMLLNILYYRPLYFGADFKSTLQNLCKFTGLKHDFMNTSLQKLLKAGYISKIKYKAQFVYSITFNGQYMVNKYIESIGSTTLYNDNV